MTDWDLMILFYDLGDGLAWNLQDHIACFKTQENARKFKDAAGPAWRVSYPREGTYARIY